MKASFYFGLLLCIIVVVDLTLWIVLSAKDVPFAQAKTLYLSYFPTFIRNATILTLLAIGLGILSIYSLSRSQEFLGVGYRRAGQLLMALNGGLIVWQLFTLM